MSDKTLKQIALSGLAFAVVSLPDLYARSNKFLHVEGNCPSWKSRLLHTLAFYVIMYLLVVYVEKSDESRSQIVKRCLASTLLFFLFSSPEMYRLTDSFKILDTADDSTACPTMQGIAVHTGLFVLAHMLLNHLTIDLGINVKLN